MANSPTHRFGQIIGDRVEFAVRKPLRELASRLGLYFDHGGARAARRGNVKVCWTDFRGNRHDLDYVLEAGGTEDVIGRPRAFIEIAYRRYTKHSRNKAQEIQGAIAPLSETYSADRPFLGAILAGVFTQGSVAQLRSHGFGVLFFPFDSIVKAFRRVGIDAWFDEDSADSDVQGKVDAYVRLSSKERNLIASTLRTLHRAEIEAFLRELETSLTRAIATIQVLALHGTNHHAASVSDAIAFIERFDDALAPDLFVRFEVSVRYTNGDEVRGSFATKLDATQFLLALR